MPWPYSPVRNPAAKSARKCVAARKVNSGASCAEARNGRRPTCNGPTEWTRPTLRRPHSCSNPRKIGVSPDSRQPGRYSRGCSRASFKARTSWAGWGAAIADSCNSSRPAWPPRLAASRLAALAPPRFAAWPGQPPRRSGPVCSIAGTCRHRPNGRKPHAPGPLLATSARAFSWASIRTASFRSSSYSSGVVARRRADRRQRWPIKCGQVRS